MRLTAGVAATALVLAACATPAPTTTTSPGTTAAPTTSTSAAPTTTTSAAADPTTSTTASATIQVIGDGSFTEQTDDALGLLAAEAPTGYAQVTLYIDTIESVVAGSGMDVFTKTYLVGNETAFAPGFEQDDQIVWLAGTIVHDSCHSRLYVEGSEYTGRDAELECLHDQLAALEAIDHDYFEEYVQGLIDGVDDPENAYWTDPNRHW